MRAWRGWRPPPRSSPPPRSPVAPPLPTPGSSGSYPRRRILRRLTSRRLSCGRSPTRSRSNRARRAPSTSSRSCSTCARRPRARRRGRGRRSSWRRFSRRCGWCRRRDGGDAGTAWTARRNPTGRTATRTRARTTRRWVPSPPRRRRRDRWNPRRRRSNPSRRPSRPQPRRRRPPGSPPWARCRTPPSSCSPGTTFEAWTWTCPRCFEPGTRAGRLDCWPIRRRRGGSAGTSSAICTRW
mmetsp:Transcript_7352/g.32432  ORF Transcript_7352/g.32432 Transcript_7352/m.32432 type:complete len:239 (-) Transcript_7352:128-844(-)